MRRNAILFTAFLLNAAQSTQAGVITFEDLNPGTNAFSNNAGPTGRFVSGGASFNNDYDPTFDVWSGWAISSVTDNTLPSGYTNQYAAVTGSGASSPTYAVAFPFGPELSTPDELRHPNSSFIDLPAGANPLSVQVTNTAYTYSILAFGDPNNFARKFVPGDFFTLDIVGSDASGNILGTVEFDLADFRNGQSLIVNTWQTVDLTSLAGSRTLRFGLRSSDNGSFGINTPAFFALDNLALTTTIAPEPSSATLLILSGIGAFAAQRLRRRPS